MACSIAADRVVVLEVLMKECPTCGSVLAQIGESTPCMNCQPISDALCDVGIDPREFESWLIMVIANYIHKYEKMKEAAARPARPLT